MEISFESEQHENNLKVEPPQASYKNVKQKLRYLTSKVIASQLKLTNHKIPSKYTQNSFPQSLLREIENNTLKKASQYRKRVFRRTVNKKIQYCTICQSEIKKNSKIGELKCKHAYHYKCLMKWIEKSLKCPLCRQNIN